LIIKIEIINRFQYFGLKMATYEQNTF